LGKGSWGEKGTFKKTKVSKGRPLIENTNGREAKRNQPPSINYTGLVPGEIIKLNQRAVGGEKEGKL